MLLWLSHFFQKCFISHIYCNWYMTSRKRRSTEAQIGKLVRHMFPSQSAPSKAFLVTESGSMGQSLFRSTTTRSSPLPSSCWYALLLLHSLVACHKHPLWQIGAALKVVKISKSNFSQDFQQSANKPFFVFDRWARRPHQVFRVKTEIISKHANHRYFQIVTFSA